MSLIRNFEDVIINLKFFYLLIRYGVNKMDSGEYDEKIPFSSVSSVVEKHLNVKPVPEDYICPEKSCNKPLFVYDKTSKNFVLSEEHIGHGGCVVVSKNYYEKFSLKNDIYTVEVKKAFYEHCDDDIPYKFYKSYDDALNDKNEVFTLEEYSKEPDVRDWDEYDKTVEKTVQKNINYLDTYIYTFNIKDNNYKLLGYKIG